MNSRRRTLLMMLVLSILMPFFAIGVDAYATQVQPRPGREVEIQWDVTNSSDAPFSMIFTGGGACNMSGASTMLFTVTETEGEIGGVLRLGNVTVEANNTDIALDLTLSVWGATAWLPGLVVNTGAANISQLNQTAFAAAERVQGNFLNGTILSYYDNVTASGGEYECIVFEYQQDPELFGNQQNYLAYSLETGILVKGSVFVNLGEPYYLELEYVGITAWTGFGIVEVVIIFTIVAVLVAVVVFIQKRIKKPERAED
ncbi:hypothetical protein EU545_03435 [Candidatus Thorarchaeota archaeon]|nr:MAG: hypothetical protein EU545_03435 [Candidatus Thorarchaeota archaeon]